MMLEEYDTVIAAANLPTGGHTYLAVVTFTTSGGGVNYGEWEIKGAEGGTVRIRRSPERGNAPATMPKQSFYAERTARTNDNSTLPYKAFQDLSTHLSCASAGPRHSMAACQIRPGTLGWAPRTAQTMCIVPAPSSVTQD